MNQFDTENQLSDIKKKYNKLLDRISLYDAKANAAQAACEGCQSSASYRLGHLLIHETKTLKDFFKLIPRIKMIKKESLGTRNATSLKPSKKVNFDTERKLSLNIPSSQKESLKEGINIILPTYKGEKTILRVLTSLAKQDLSCNLFEVIVIINGEKDNTETLVSHFCQKNPNLNIRIFTLNDSGASLARNKGLDEINYKYTTFIDDDDAVSPTYLSAMYDLASDDTIVLSQIVNIEEESVDASNAINMQILKSDPTKDNLFKKCPSVLTINACKLIPSSYMKQLRFNISLKSGEDVAYFSELFSLSSFRFQIAKEAIYFRFMKHNSVSRKPLSFKFNVEERLQVIATVLQTMENTRKKDIHIFLQQKISGQINFINTYLKQFPNEYEKILKEIKKKELHTFPYYKLQKQNNAKDLIISYCFTPYVDTSAVVMAKRVRDKKKIVDVVYNDMSPVRIKDERLNALADDMIDERLPIQTPTNFSQWDAIEAFSKMMMKKIKHLDKDPYESIYSRVMWPASNFAAFEYKLQYPETRWIAEFSDPILFDIHGEVRYSKITNKWHYQVIESLLQKRGFKMPKSDNLFFWCEYLAYLFADELIFTNQNQLFYMLEKTEQALHDIITKKATISSHPTLPKEYYYIMESHYSLNKNKVNLAYFGTFYQTRKLNDIIEIVKTLSSTYREKVVIHIFTNSKEELTDLIDKNQLSVNFRVNDYVSYFEFLNLTTKFDCLILNDAITKPGKSFNPYLPSKLSDYKGSSQSIWGLYENDSIISNSEDIKYKSELGQISKSCKILEKIIDDYINKKSI